MPGIRFISDVATAEAALVELRVGDAEFATLHEELSARLPLAEIIDKYIVIAGKRIMDARKDHDNETIRAYIDLLNSCAIPLMIFEKQQRLSHPTDSEGTHLNYDYSL